MWLDDNLDYDEALVLSLEIIERPSHLAFTEYVTINYHKHLGWGCHGKRNALQTYQRHCIRSRQQQQRRNERSAEADQFGLSGTGKGW